MKKVIKHTDGNYYLQLEDKTYRKIIASTDSSLNLPLLSEQSIKLLIDYYNQFGKMPEFVETTVWELHNEVDITIPEERKYSREEVEIMLKDILNIGMNLRQEQLRGYSDKSGIEVLKEYIKQNL